MKIKIQDVLLVPVIILVLASAAFSKDIDGIITVDGIEREYILHLPKTYEENTGGKNTGGDNLPLVMVFHGGGGNARQMKNHTKFNKLSDKENFIVVYPNAVDKNWSDGRIGEKLPMQRDDVKFISNLIDTLTAKYKIDPKRIFSTGISNGGFFSIYLAYRLSNKILAIAPVTANIAVNLADEFKPDYPVSILLINGTEDPLVKYDGGAVGFGEDGYGRGESVSTDQTISIWTKNNECNINPLAENLDNKNWADKCKAKKYIYSNCAGETEVILVKIEGGGHTWPGGSQYLPKMIVGNVCKDFSATEMIWEFFKSQKSRN
jgi:polyhydroxybutyrate depolymerase